MTGVVDLQVDIAATVVLAYTDISATASRAMFSLDVDRVFQKLTIPVLDGRPPACVHGPNTKVTPKTPPMDVVQVINCRYLQKRRPQFTFIIINTQIPGEKSHHVAKFILDLCTERCVAKLIVLSAQRMQVDLKTKMFENTFNGMPPATQRNSLPPETIITDAFLSNLIQLFIIDGRPFSVVIAPAHRMAPGQANLQDGSLQLIRLFQNTITDAYGLIFSDVVSASLVYRDSSEAQSDLMYA